MLKTSYSRLTLPYVYKAITMEHCPQIAIGPSRPKMRSAYTLLCRYCFHWCASLAVWINRWESPPVLRQASGRTVDIHSLLGLPTLLTYLFAADCKVPGTNDTFFRMLPSGALITLPRCTSCRDTNFADALSNPARSNTSLFETLEKKAG